MIKKLSLIFGSKTKAEEMVYLVSDAKYVVRQGFYLEELPKIEKFDVNPEVIITIVDIIIPIIAKIVFLYIEFKINFIFNII
mgnify:CR=1 FL=1